MSSSELPNTMAPNVQASTNSNRDNQPLFSISPQHTTHDSSSPASMSTVRMPQADWNEGNGSAAAAGGREGDRNSGLGMGMPLPPVQSPLLQQAQPTATHSQPTTSLMVAQSISESPSSIGSLIPRGVPSPGLQRPPSPPLPPPPPIQRPSQAAVSHSNTGVSAPGRSLSFLDAAPPSRHGSTGARTNNNEYGPGYNNNSNNLNRSGNGNGTTNACRNCDRRPMSSFTSSVEKAGTFLDPDPARVFHVDLEYGHGVDQRDPRYRDSGLSMPIPVSMRETLDSSRRMDGGGDGNGRPDIRISATSDSIGVPLIPRTVQERLQPTISHAMEEEVKYARKARISGYALNIAIGLQVFLSALITALSAVTTGRRTQIMTSVLGGAGTIVASYLARARGSNEPELSIARTKDLQRFIRTCDAFVQDHGLETGFEDSEGKQGGTRDLQRAKELDDRIGELRVELEHLLGNGDGERKLAPLV
ncbi:hypothetical protein ACEPAF_5594 [Sanghuangporus sanghuang]